MNGFNKVILAGNLTRDPELRFAPSGMAICKFGLAINRKWRDGQGQVKEEVTFVDVDAFGKQAETIGQYLKKGRPLLVEGRLRLETWEDKQTQAKRSRLGVVLESFTFLESGGARGGENGGGGGAAGSEGNGGDARAAAPEPATAGVPTGMEEDDVPF
jgi:single-strand DNA-binding protein